MSQLIIVCVIVWVLVMIPLAVRQMGYYWRRRCTGFAWHRCFPGSTATEIREFLDVFVESFGFLQSRRLCFAPDDRVMDIYRRCIPFGTADAIELDELAVRLQKRYSIDVYASWREDITLGDLFGQTRQVA